MPSSSTSSVKLFFIPGARVHPGYWIATIIFMITALDMVSSRGWIYGTPPFVLALVLPFVSYLARSGRPRVVEVNNNEKTITQVFQRFGRINKVKLDARRFSSVYLKIQNSRFPKVCLMLQTLSPSENDVELVLTDTVSDQHSSKFIPVDVVPKPIMELVAALEKEFFHDVIWMSVA